MIPLLMRPKSCVLFLFLLPLLDLHFTLPAHGLENWALPHSGISSYSHNDSAIEFAPERAK